MAVIWIVLELIFLFFFFELPPIDDTVKSKYEEYLEHSQQTQSSGVDKERNENPVNDDIKERHPSHDTSMSTSEQEKLPLLTNESMKDIQAQTADHQTTPQPKKIIQRVYWLLSG